MCVCQKREAAVWMLLRLLSGLCGAKRSCCFGLSGDIRRLGDRGSIGFNMVCFGSDIESVM